MVFLEHAPASTVRALVVWADPAPLLTDACALFEGFGLQAAAHPNVDAGTVE